MVGPIEGGTVGEFHGLIIDGTRVFMGVYPRISCVCLGLIGGV
jgi:hypothetical protein